MKKQALLIGINQYQILPELKYARQDAEAVEQALKQNYGFSDNEVLLLTDAKPGLLNPSSSNIILRHLKELENQELDLFIFGFWGHGVFRKGLRYFCPSNVVDDAIEEMGFSFSQLQSALSNIKAKNTCMILDCCQKVHDRGNSDVLTAADQDIIENAARDIVLKRKEQIPDFQSNVAILNSCDKGQSAYEWDKRKHGIFTAHLLDAMNRRFDSVSKIVSYISNNIGKTALELGKTQTPYYSLKGDIPLPVDTKSSPLVTGDVFVSYRHCNADLVAPVEEELKRRGISYFIDREGVNYGMEYSEAITTAITASKVMLLFWTPEVKGSKDIIKEVTLAQECNKPVIPYKIGNFNHVEHTKLCYHIAHLSRYEVPQQSPETVTELVNRVNLILTGKQPVSHVTFNLPEKSEDAVIKKPVIKDINVSFTPEQVVQKIIQTDAIPLPPLPKELLDIKAENRGLQKAIEQLQTFTHKSLSQANAALEQAQAQFQAWKERKEQSWKSLPTQLRLSLEEIIFDNPECTEEDINVSLDNLSYQEYFDFIERFQCGKKYEQAWRELGRVEQERQIKCQEVITKVKNKIADNNIKIKKISDKFFNETLMTILAVMPGYNELSAPFPLEKILTSLRQLEKYELGWRAQDTLSRARYLWKEQRPCILKLKEIERKKAEEKKKHDLSIPGTKAGERKNINVKGIEFAFRWCPAGSFMMGSPESEEDRVTIETQHPVNLTKGFWIMETEVTVGMFKAFVNDTGYESKGYVPYGWTGSEWKQDSKYSWQNPGFNQDDRHPVTCVSWNDAVAFSEWLSKKTGLKILLPTEAQWEYACRAGTTTAYFWGNALNGDKANCNGNYPYGGVSKGKYIGKTTPVGSYQANAWGLFDMHGNVCEWCIDRLGNYPNKKVENPLGASSGSSRVYRGGDWHYDAKGCRSAFRNGNASGNRSSVLGFRCVKNQ